MTYQDQGQLLGRSEFPGGKHFTAAYMSCPVLNAIVSLTEADCDTKETTDHRDYKTGQEVGSIPLLMAKISNSANTQMHGENAYDVKCAM
ncbi:hypothetical protein AGOR_G00113810 [Albula goreensis]|uniref:Uncharacterized protein n=1 Tax=Albula goreensis TaxID=1534307 RepID=A0A8T3DAE8_9TELE|nr:hypothetical protein AGOR_G00113810 [Albula goreensis]